MLIKLFNSDGLIYSYFEWDVVDEQGKSDNNGKYMHVRDIWVHNSFYGDKILLKFIYMLNKEKINKSVRYIYWTIRNSTRISRTYKRETALRRLECLYQMAS